MRNNKENQKICPMLDRPCVKSGCRLYNYMLDRCEISMLAYNLYLLKRALEERDGITQE